MPNDRYGDDDGRVIADMSEVERTPILMPRFGKKDGARADFREPGEDGPAGGENAAPVVLSREERRALIKGGVAAGLVVVLALAAGFAALIFLINLISR